MISLFNKLLLFLISFLFLNSSAFSQNLCSLTIKVLDEETSEVIRNATVLLDGPNTETQTADMGSAIFISVSPGTYNITVKAEGYYDKTGSLMLDPSKKKEYSGSFKLKSIKAAKQAVQTPDKTKSPPAPLVKLSIKLIDSESEAPLKNATVEIGRTQKQKKDAINGAVTFENVPDGSCSITVNADGYEEKSGKIVIDAKKKLEYSGTLKLIKKKQPVPELSSTSTKINDIVSDIKEDAVKTIEEKKPLIVDREKAKTPEPVAITPPVSKPISEQSAQKPIPLPDNKQTVAAQPAPPVNTEAWYAPFLKPVMISASIFSSLLMIAFLLGLFIKWSEMTAMVKAVSGIGALGCGTLTFIIITATFVMFFSLKSGTGVSSGKTAQKAAAETKINEVKKIFEKTEPKDIESKTVVIDNTASKHDMGSMIFIKAIKDNNAKEKEKGLALLEEAFRAEPGNVLYTIDLADAYVQMNTLLYMKLATDLYRGLLEDAPENDKLLARTSDAYARMSQYDKAFQFAARRAWSGKTSPVGAASQIALISLVSGDFERGISELSKMIRGGPPETPELKLILAGLYGENDQKDKAVEVLDSIIASLPVTNDLCQRAQVIKRSIVK